MKKIKIMSVFGTRPEAIKMAPVVNELKKREEIESLVCVTAQHRGMLDQVLDIFDIHPTYDLDIMKERQTLSGITVRALEGLEKAMKDAQPDMVLVHGDTTTTFVGALAAFYNKIQVGHVEAGLRTFDKYQPFPEEMNRKLTTSIADLHFAPTGLAKKHLLNENIDEKIIHVTGNTAIDALKTTVEKHYVFNEDKLNRINYSENKIITMTAHRRENLGKPLENICEAVLDIVNAYKDVEVVYAVHYNPAVREVVYKILGNHERIHLLDPLDINDMHNLLNKSYLVLTDSGGLQEEVPSLGKPVLVLRNVTERPEGVEAGTLKLVGTDKNSIYKMTSNLLENEKEYEKMAKAVNPFGDGFSSVRIADNIISHFKG